MLFYCNFVMLGLLFIMLFYPKKTSPSALT